VLALAGALVDELDLDAVVEERELAQALGEDLVVELDVAESDLRREEVHLGAAPLGVPGGLQRLYGHAVVELHEVRMAVAPDAQLEPLRKRIDDRDPHAVQAARNLVRVLVELAPRVQ